MADFITIPRYTRSDGTVVEEHERKVTLRDRFEDFNQSVDDMSDLQKALIVGSALVLGTVGGRMLLRHHGLLPTKANPGVLKKDFADLDWSDAWTSNFADATKNENFPDLTVLGKKDFSLDVAKPGYFRPEAYKHLEGKTYTETMSNVEKAIKGRKVEHSFIIDDDGTILFGARGNASMAPMFVPHKHIPEAKKYTFTHNHPANLPYSGGDLLAQTFYGIGRGRAVEPNGTVTEFLFDIEATLPLGGTPLGARLAIQAAASDQAEIIADIASKKNPRTWKYRTAARNPKFIDETFVNDEYRRRVMATYKYLEDNYPGVFAIREYKSVVKRSDVLIEGQISKVDDEQRQVFGWASVTELNGEPVIDLQNDVMETLELEKAAYSYVLNSRVGGEMHERVEKSKPKKVAELIESMVLTPEKIEKMGLPPETPRGWWIGFQIGRDETGDRVWDAVKKGKYTGFSIHGLGKRVEKTLDEINKSTVVIEIPEYTKKDGTVVEAHQRKIDTGQAVSTGVSVGLAAATGGIATSHLRAGAKGTAALYGAYSLFSLLNAISSGNKTIKPTAESESEHPLVRSLLSAAEIAYLTKSDGLTTEKFDRAVNIMADHVGDTPKRFLERLGEYTEGMKMFTERDLENFLDSYTVQKHLIGEHDQEDHDPSKKKKKYAHSREDHGDVEFVRGQFKGEKPDITPEDAAGWGALAGSILGFARGGNAGAAGGALLGSLVSYQSAGGQIFGSPSGHDIANAAAGIGNTLLDPTGTAIRRYNFGNPNEQLKKSVGGSMTTRIDFLIEKAQEHADSEDELIDNLADIVDEVEKMLVQKTDKEEVSKETVIVEQYTRADGTVVPRHEREISPRAAAALAGAAGIGVLAATPWGRRMGASAGRGIASGAQSGFQGIQSGLQGVRSGIQNARNSAGGMFSLSGPASRAMRSTQNAGNATRNFGSQAASGARNFGSQAASGARNFGSQASSGARNFGTRAQNFASRSTPNLQMQSGVAAQGIASGARRAGRETAARGRIFGAQVQAQGNRLANSSFGQTAAEFGRGGRDVVRRPSQYFDNAFVNADVNPRIAYSAGGGAVAGGIYGGAVGGAAAGYEHLQNRQRTRKSLTDDEIQTLEKYLGRNLDG